MKYILLTALIFYSMVVTGQTPKEIEKIKMKTNVESLGRLASKFSAERIANKNKALKLAAERNWPKSVSIGNGVYKELAGVTDDLQPIYFQPLDRNAVITSRSNYLHNGGGLGLSVHGESMTAGVWDAAGTHTSHETFENRAIQMDSMAIIDSGPNAWLSNHATASAGILIGSNKFVAGKAMGVAFKGNVKAYGSWSNDVAQVSSEVSQGLLLSNHSYTATSLSSSYQSRTANFDQIMYNAPYYLSVWACGNSGGPKDLLTGESVVKNGIAVANTYAVLNYTGPSSVYIGNQYGVGPSRGPSDDGRVKPDISVAGSSIYPYFYSPVTGTSYYTDGFPGDTSASTTSAAAPLATGTLMLLQQHYNNVNGDFMRSSTLRGLILHTADECGPSPGPDITFGWGLINGKKAAEAITNNGGSSFIVEDSLASTWSYTREVVASGSEPLIATVCWTDPAGTPVGDNNSVPQLVNDLDLRIVSGATTYYPWKLNLSNVTGPALNNGDNNRDNVEKIELSNPIAGQVYSLTITHKGALANNGQRFSLIVTGLDECVSEREVASPVNTASVDHQQADSTIRIFNTLKFDAEGVYHAGTEIVMTNGFTALSGSRFRAYIEGCSTDYSARLAPVERPVVTYKVARQVQEAILKEGYIYPNPGNGLFKIKLSELSEGTVEIINQNGRKLLLKKFKDLEEMDINIKSELPGIYFVKVTSGDKVFKKKIVKE
jgi:hypothetical protein